MTSKTLTRTLIAAALGSLATFISCGLREDDGATYMALDWVYALEIVSIEASSSISGRKPSLWARGSRPYP